MNRRLVVIALIGLFLLPALYSGENPALSSDAPARGLELQADPFLPSVDGAESSESIPYFNETLDNDVLHFPDVFLNTTGQVADGGEVNYAESFVLDGTDWIVTETGAGNESAYFLFPSSGYVIEGFNYYFYGQANSYGYFKIYNGTGWEVICDIDEIADSWFNGSYFLSTSVLDYDNYTIGIFAEAALAYIRCDYLFIEWQYMTLTDDDHFAESFADVSEWVRGGSGFDASDTIVTDGDVATIDLTCNNVAGEYISFTADITNISVDDFTYIIEIRYRISNNSAVLAHLRLVDDDGSEWTCATGESLTSESWTTLKIQMSDFTADSDYDVGDSIDKVRLYLDDYPDTTNSGNYEFDGDYLRISPVNETGWQHDGSVARYAAFINEVNSTVTSDGDILHYYGEHADFSGIYLEDSSTDFSISSVYYPFVEVRAKVLASSLTMRLQDSGSNNQYHSIIPVGTGEWVTYRGNIRANTALNIEEILIYNGENNEQNFWIDYIKFYSIANFTVTQLANPAVTDYLYVDSGTLHASITTTWFDATWEGLRIDYDPTLAVNTATYPVWNMTSSDFENVLWNKKVGGSWEGHSSVGETRGTWTNTGTFSDFEVLFWTTSELSAITFIEDATAPSVVRSFATPDPANDDETVTLSAVVEDPTEVYSVNFNAITYPVGFSDVDYSASEQTDNLWTYSFSTLTTGYYCFKIIGSDGANINALTEYGYISLTVREAEITVETYTLFGAGSDFTYMQYSGHISHDCSFIIEEWSDTWAINETHSGSVSAGDFNIAWDKIGVNDIDANYTITFTNASLTKEITSSYQTAYKYLRIADIDCDNLESSDSWVTNITVNFYTNKAVDWYIYDVDDNDAVLGSGSSVEGTDTITWVQNTARGAHYFAVKWTDGVSSEWYNSSYWIYDKNIDDLPGGGDLDGGDDDRRTIQMWATIGAIIGFVGIVCIGLVYFKLDDMKSIQLPHYETQPGKRRK